MIGGDIIEAIGFVYMTINKINNKKYIGQHTKFDDNYLGSGKIIRLAIKKYGKDNFERIILDYAYSQEELNIKEKYFIQHYNAINNKDFYNIHVGGEGGDTFSGRTAIEKANFKKKMSILTKGEKNGMFGKQHKAISRHKIKFTRNANKDKYNFSSEEFKKKMSDVTKGENNGMYGRHHSEISKVKMSENSKGKALGEKNGMYGMKDEKAINTKKIYQYVDKEKTIVINEFNSIKCTLKFLSVKGHIGLIKALREGSEYKGHYWSRERKV